MNYFLEASQIAAIMKQAGARALIAAGPSIFPDIWPKVEAIRLAMPELKVFRIGGGPAAAGVIDYEQACAAQPADRLLAPKAIGRDTVAALFHTGGTTGLPKLARHTHGALTLMAWTNVLVFDLGPGTVLLNPLPQFHVGGSLFGALSPIANGWTIVVPTPLGARNPNVVRDYWSIVERNKVTVGGAVPTTLAAIMNVPRDGHDLSSLKAFVTGGSTVPVELIRRIEREIDAPVVEGYGMTEVHCYSTMNPLHGERRPGSVGLRLPYTEIRIADVAPDGAIRRDCATGEIGHVLMRGPQVTPGYLEPCSQSGSDAGRRLAGFRRSRPGRCRGLCLADRTLEGSDHPRRSQHRSRDHRGGAQSHPAVETAAAVGLPDTYAGELPMVFVQLRPDASATAEELREVLVAAKFRSAPRCPCRSR